MPGPNKYVTLDPASGGHKETLAPATSAGAGSAGFLPALDATGKLDISFMPSQLGVQVQAVTTSEAITAGSMVNIYAGAGNTFLARNADAASNKPAHGFVRAAVASGGVAQVFTDGIDDAQTGLTPGRYFLGAAGAITQVVPSGTGTLLQIVGAAVSATQLDFQPGSGVVLA